MKFTTFICLAFFVVMGIGVALFNVFHKEYYVISNDGMEPIVCLGDSVSVKSENLHEEGDIIVYTDDLDYYLATRVLHAQEMNGVYYYVCHGDNSENFDGTESDGDWQDDLEYLKQALNDNDDIEEFCNNHYTAILIKHTSILGTVDDTKK